MNRATKSVKPAYITDALRSPVGKGKSNGALSGVHAVELLSQVIGELVDRSGIDPSLVDDVIIGCVSQAKDQATTPGRMAWLAAGLPASVPATTIDRRCGSSEQALHFGAQGIMAGVYNCVVVGGVESMSRVPLAVARMGVDTFGPSVTERYAPGLVPQGISAELVAAKWGLTRNDLDEYSLLSHMRAATQADTGSFDREIVPIREQRDGETVLDRDETIRRETNLDALGKLKPAFEDATMAERFPEINWVVTAGNSSQISDGASAILLMSEEFSREHSIPLRAAVRSFAVCGDDPVLMLTGPIEATQRVLGRAGLTVADVDHFEVNEAFASVPLAWAKELHVDIDRLNPCGGAIALGHPLGSSGTRLMTTMLHHLERTRGRIGLQTMCEGGGMANATLIELV